MPLFPKRTMYDCPATVSPLLHLSAGRYARYKKQLFLKPVDRIKNLLFFSLLMLAGLASHCQTDTFYEALMLPSGSYSVMDMVKTSDKHIILLSMGEAGLPLIVKVDTLGNILWQKNLVRATPEGGFPQRIIETTDSAIIIVSRMVISGYGVFSIVKLDAEGNFVWAKQSSHGSSNSAADLTATENGGFALITGGCVWGHTLSLFSGNGEVVGQRICPGAASINNLDFISRKNDQGLVISGITGESSGNGLSLYSLDPTGQMIWLKTFPFPGDIQNTGLTASMDGGYTLTGNVNPPGSYNYRPFLLHTDSAGNLLWVNKYEHNLKCTPNAIIQLADSDYVMTGNIYYPGAGSKDVQMLNIKTDQFGKVIWAHSMGSYLYQGGGYDDFLCSEWIEGNNFYTAGQGGGAVFTKNNGTLGTGSCGYDTVAFTAVPIPMLPEDHTSPIWWTFRTFDADTFSTVSTRYTATIYCTTEVAIKEQPGRKSLRVYPDPFSSSANIAFNRTMNNAQLDIFNVQGFRVKSVKNIFSNSLILNRGHLPDGLYYLRLTEQDQLIATGKFVIFE